MRLSVSEQRNLIKEVAENDLIAFIRLVHPHRVLGQIHEELIRWWTRQDAKTHQLVLLPRDHMKSALIAYRVAWEITKNPTVRVLYISSTSNLATKQLKFIKDILVSSIYRKYWPEMVNENESDREKWTETEIAVDHPARKAETVRDPTILTAGLTTGIVGFHCDIAVMDDVVVRDNAYTADGRDKVKTQHSLLASIESADSREWVVGTRYFPSDLYYEMQEVQVDQYNDEGDVIGSEPLYETFERVVEDAGDGTGQFLWPRQQRTDGKWFGFDQRILAEKRAKYHDRLQFRAQYYNDPNDKSLQTISNFQYYDKAFLKKYNDKWFYKREKLNVFAAVDFAFSLNKKADYTAVVVVGVDYQNNYYVLDIERFKSTRIAEYFDVIMRLHNKWNFRKIRAEVTVAQQVIVNDLKENYIRPYGLNLSVDEFKPNRHGGTKEERVEAILQARYENGQIWHYKGGNTQILEEELVQQNPAHDDIKDCLASCIDVCVAPSRNILDNNINFDNNNPVLLSHPRFGGLGRV